MSFCEDVTDHCTIAGSPGQSCHGILVSIGRTLTTLRCADVHLARFIEGVQNTGLDVHDISLASGSANVLGYEVSPANPICSGTDKRTARIRSVARTVSSRRRIGGRTMELGISALVTSLSWRSAIVMLEMEPCRGNDVHRIEGKYIHQENGQF